MSLAKTKKNKNVLLLYLGNLSAKRASPNAYLEAII